MKRIFIFLIAILTLATVTHGQTRKLQFYGYRLSEYQRPVQMQTNKYEPYFENSEAMEAGRIIIEETTKTFTVKWRNGNDWIGKYTKKEIKNEHSDMWGDVERTYYSGKWSEENIDCLLVIMKTKNNGCIATIKSRKVVDKDYGIDTWKKIFTLDSQGDCLEYQ